MSYVAEPGGSVRDDAVIEACDKYGMVMAFTGIDYSITKNVGQSLREEEYEDNGYRRGRQRACYNQGS